MSYGQVDINQLKSSEAVQEVNKDDINQDELEAKLKEKGIDINNVRPDQIGGLESIVKQTIEEMQSDKLKAEEAKAIKENKIIKEEDDTIKLGKQNQVIDSTAFAKKLESKTDGLIKNKAKQFSEELNEAIQEAIENGASPEEAITEILLKKQGYSKNSEIYGHHIFQDQTLELFRTTTSNYTPSNYLLDHGDEITINIFGPSQADLVYEIESDGFIRPTGMPKIYLKGVPFSKAKEMIYGRFSQAFSFSREQYNVSISTARTISVSIYGEVERPGTYTISALNTALNALIAAGGPSQMGSVRNIILKSNGKEKTIDVYEFLNSPSNKADYHLKDGDIIFVPVINKLINIYGSINRPFKYELKKNENLDELIKFAGGLNVTSYLKNFHIIRFIDDQRKLIDLDYKQLQNSKTNYQLNDKDVVYFRAIKNTFKNYIKASGAFEYEGNYEYFEGMKVSNVLEKALLKEEARNDFAFITRKNTDGTFKLIKLQLDKIISDNNSQENIELQKEDVIKVYDQKYFTNTYRFSIEGAIKYPSNYSWDPANTITISDAILMSGGLKPNAINFGYIIHKPTNNSLEREYEFVNLTEAVANPKSASDLIIRPQDQIIVPTLEYYSDQFEIVVEGAVRSPGTYVYNPSLSLKDVLIMAGGLKLEAATNKVDIFRLKITENESTETYATTVSVDRDLNPMNDDVDFSLKPYDHIVVRYAPDYEPIQYVKIEGQVKYPGTYALLKQNEKIYSLIKRAGGLRENAFAEGGKLVRKEDNIGRVVTRIDKVLIWGETSKYNVSLKAGDVLTIPKIKDVVKINIANTNAFELYTDANIQDSQLNIVVAHKNRNAKFFINHYAGGFAKGVKRKKTIVLYPNGRIKKARSFLFINFYPKVTKGSEITIFLRDRYLKRMQKEKIELEKLKNDTFGAPKEKLSVFEKVTILTAITGSLTGATSAVIQTLILSDSRNNNDNNN